MFSGLHARCEFKKASVCERNDLKLKGYGLLGSEERCHCVGDRSSITERCEVGSMGRSVTEHRRGDIGSFDVRSLVQGEREQMMAVRSEVRTRKYVLQCAPT